MTAIKEQFMQILPQMQRDIRVMSDSDVQQIINIYFQLKPKDESEKPFERTFGKLKDKITYVAPDFDSCIDDDPAAFGLEEYM